MYVWLFALETAVTPDNVYTTHYALATKVTSGFFGFGSASKSLLIFEYLTHQTFILIEI